MLKKLKRKFILITMTFITLILVCVITLLCLASYQRTKNDINNSLNFALYKLANPDAVSAIVNISANNIPTAEQIDNMLVDAKATPASTYIFCHPKVLSMLNKYKGNVLQTMTGDMDVNRSFAAWNGIRFITSYNFENGSEKAVELA